MTLRSHALCVVLLLASVASVSSADEPLFEPGRVFVRLQPGASIAAINATYGTIVQPGQAVPSRQMYLLTVPSGTSESGLIDQLALDPRVLRADFNFYLEDANPEGSTRRMYLGSTFADYVNDAAPGIIGVPASFSQSRGAGTRIAILDTGVDSTHPLLSSRIAPGGFNFIAQSSSTLDVAQGVDTNENGEIDQMFGHGTMVAGLALRVAPDAKVLPIVVLDSDGYSTIFRVAQGLYHALDAGATVANVSMGMEVDPPLLRETIADVESQGLAVVASAGNRSTSNPDFPAGTSALGTLAVASVDDAGVRADFSNYGSWVSLTAPGVGIVSTVPGGGFGIASGTSLSAPLVSGAVAAVAAICPLVSPQALDAIVRSRATPNTSQNPSYIGQLGSGVLSVSRAVGAQGGELSCDCDTNNDLRITLADLHTQATQPKDLNADGVADAADTTSFAAWLRRTEKRGLLR
jgi:subtilisin family serine protease